MRRTAGTALLSVLFVGFFGSSLFLQDELLDELTDEFVPFRDALYLPSSDYIKIITLGYDHFAADFLWLRAIQASGAGYTQEAAMDQMVAYFDVITDLDPRFIVAYSFGNLVLGEEGGRNEEAMALLDKGIAANPDQYRLAFEAAFYSFWTLKDADQAKRYVKLALKASDCPAYVSGWVAYMDMQMGRYRAALEVYLRDYIKNTNSGDEQIAEMRLTSLRRSLSDWYLEELRGKALEYRMIHGRNPTVAELSEQGAFAETELPDFWGGLLPRFLKPAMDSGSALPESEEALQAVIESIMKTGWTEFPRDPVSNNVTFSGFVIRPGALPFTDGDVELISEWPGVPDSRTPAQILARAGEPEREWNETFVISEIEMAARVRGEMIAIDRLVTQYKEENNGECPTLEEIAPTLNVQHREPWGGEYILDPVTCSLVATSHPNLPSELGAAPPL